MSTETDLTETTPAEVVQEVSTRDLLLRYLRQNGYKLLKDEIVIPEKKDGLLAVARHGRKELIDVRSLPAVFPLVEKKEGQLKKTDLLLHAMQSVAEALFHSFVHVGKYFQEEKIASALAVPDTERYRQIIGKLEDYFTENNLDFKIYLLAENGTVRVQNLNQKHNKDSALPKAVMEKRTALLGNDQPA